VEEAWKSWVSDASSSNIKALPLLVCWDTWLAKNSVIFHNKGIPSEMIVAQCLSILAHFPQTKGKESRRVIKA